VAEKPVTAVTAGLEYAMYPSVSSITMASLMLWSNKLEFVFMVMGKSGLT
jgi:hypothetical protein